ncbi:metallo-beta-lactamase family protein [Tanacetum coccineum]|uniref:Metallo-beta-lactamase family protein n=1 Tax=Tanacetum coccineum TaxID=301880 RepID=A0ABQ5G180_9ASTR
MATMMQLRYLPNYNHRFLTSPSSSTPWRSSSVKLVVKSQSVQVQGSSKKQRRPENVAGEFFVDHTCIDCDTCRWMAPEVFTRVNDMSAVSKQPSSEKERLKALQFQRHYFSTEKPARDILEVQKTFPLPVDVDRIPGVYHCGYHSDKSYGAASYLIVHPQGNILVDSPRYTERLARNIEKMGGVRYMFLTHKDDVADHEKWSERFKCINNRPGNVEIKLDGSGPWDLGEDIQLIHTPGHTEPLKVLFTGDHLALEDSELYISEEYNFYSVPIQLDSVAMLLELDFEWILPGHARRIEFKDVEEKNATIKAFLTARQHTHAF